MKKLLEILLGGLILTGCGSSKKNTTGNPQNNNGGNEQTTTEKTVMKDKIFEGLEFINIIYNIRFPK